MKTHKCRKCGVGLDEENWTPSYRKTRNYICKGCHNKRMRLWQKANPEKAKAKWTKRNRKQGFHLFTENREGAMFLGVHVAERVLSHVFKNVKWMPMNNPGYDVICNRDKLIDIKSSCQRKDGTWTFTIRHNPIANFFLLLAFDNREDLNPIHAWLIPGSKLNHLELASISPSTIHKWNEYGLDISKIITCCDTIRGREDCL